MRLNHRHEIIHRLLIGEAVAVGTTIRHKPNVYCTVYCITLNFNCEAQRTSKDLKKIVEKKNYEKYV